MLRRNKFLCLCWNLAVFLRNKVVVFPVRNCKRSCPKIRLAQGSHDGFRWSESWEQTTEIYTGKNCGIVEGRWHVSLHSLFVWYFSGHDFITRPPIIMIWRKEFHNLFTYLRVLQAQYGRILQSFLMNDCSSPHHSGKRKNSEWNWSHFELIPFSNEPAACWRVY